MGILDGIVEWIAEQIMYGLDLINTSVLGALGCDMNTFLRYFPAAETMYSLLVALAIGLILLGWVWNLFKNYGLGLGVDAEDPVKLTAKAILFIVLAYYADEIVNIALTIGGTPYAWILSSELPSLDFASFNSVLLTIIGVCANGGVALIVLILTLILAWNYIILTVDAKDRIETEDERREIIWHEIKTSHVTGRILTGILSGVEQTPSGITVVVLDYKGFRIAIPLKEMMLYSGPVPHGAKYKPFMERMNGILSTMLTAEIDFIVRGLNHNERSAVASRKAAMLRKRQTFYLDTNEDGEPLVYEGRVVQARVIGVAEKSLRVDVFGVECTIFARDLSNTWFGDAHEYYSVGDRVLVRVLTIDRSDINRISITADIRSVLSDANQRNLDKCVLQGKYAGRVTDVRHGVVFIRLNNGVNAIAHTCYDRRMPGKKDTVSFAVTRLDEERGIAVGIITRIIKQNL